MTPAEARAAVLAALTGQGLRVAGRGADITPPCVYVKRRGTASMEVMLAGGARSIFAVHWIPIRGVDDPAGEDDAHARILAALEPLAVETVDLEETSVSVGDTSWPCWMGLAVVV